MNGHRSETVIRRGASEMAPMRQGFRDRRRFFRVAVSLNGRLMATDGRDYPCHTLDASPGSLRLATAAPLSPGDQIVVYCEELGRLKGHVSRLAADGSFGVALDVTPLKREKLAEVLIWKINGGDDEGLGSRRAARRSERAPAECVLEDGRRFQADLIDVSLVGAALKTAERPLIGSWIKVGRQIGRVARYFEGGVGVDFSTPQAVAPDAEPEA